MSPPPASRRTLAATESSATLLEIQSTSIVNTYSSIRANCYQEDSHIDSIAMSMEQRRLRQRNKKSRHVLEKLVRSRDGHLIHVFLFSDEQELRYQLSRGERLPPYRGCQRTRGATETSLPVQGLPQQAFRTWDLRNLLAAASSDSEMVSFDSSE